MHYDDYKEGRPSFYESMSSNTELALECPCCGGYNLHTHGAVELDISYGGYDIAMYCENCPADIVLRVLSHKGTVFLSVFSLANGRAVERRESMWKYHRREKAGE